MVRGLPGVAVTGLLPSPGPSAALRMSPPTSIRGRRLGGGRAIGLELGERLAVAFAVEYAERGYTPEPDAWEGPDSGGLRVVTPAKALAWFDFPGDVTRFRFPS